MTKSNKDGKVVYNFLDEDRDNFEIIEIGNTLSIYYNGNKCILNLNQTITKDLIKVLQEFSETGKLK